MFPGFEIFETEMFLADSGWVTRLYLSKCEIQFCCQSEVIKLPFQHIICKADQRRQHGPYKVTMRQLLFHSTICNWCSTCYIILKNGLSFERYGTVNSYCSHCVSCWLMINSPSRETVFLFLILALCNDHMTMNMFKPPNSQSMSMHPFE